MIKEGGCTMDQRKIGGFIAVLRNEKGMTQAELGDRIGFTNKTISRWENGNYMPDISVIPMLCVELGISANELLYAERLMDSEFKEKADGHLMETLNHIKNFKHEKSCIDFLTGAGTGIVLSCMYSPYSTKRTIVLFIGVVMIAFGWYKKAKYDKKIFQYLGDGKDD